MLFSYSIGFVYLFFLVAVFTDIASAINYCSYYPKHTYGYAFIFSLTGYLGIQVNFLSVEDKLFSFAIFRLFWVLSDNLEHLWQLQLQHSGKLSVLSCPLSSSPNPSPITMSTAACWWSSVFTSTCMPRIRRALWFWPLTDYFIKYEGFSMFQNFNQIECHLIISRFF